MYAYNDSFIRMHFTRTVWLDSSNIKNTNITCSASDDKLRKSNSNSSFEIYVRSTTYCTFFSQANSDEVVNKHHIFSPYSEFNIQLLTSAE